LFEPLQSTAPLAREYAIRFCRSGLAGRGGCFWYHGIWQYLRLLGVAASPERHAGFFGRAFASLAADGGFSRVLICGTADYALLAHLVRAYGQAGGRARTTIIDRCETPLALCRWYAARVGEKVETARAEALDYRPARPFDLICTHSFLSRFPAVRREGLMAAWRAALRPGGRLVTSTRLNPSWSEHTAGFSPLQAAQFGDRVRTEAQARSGIIDLAPDEIARLARHYAILSRNYSPRTEDEVCGLLMRGGFAIEHLGIVELGGSFATGGPGTSQTALYAEIVARRV
jgi:SAM-dependent methyltransferase